MNKGIEDSFHGLKHRVNKIEIQTVKYSYKNEYYQSLFIEILKSKKLLSLKKMFDEEFKLKARHFFPHISLFYGQENESIKNLVISNLSKVSKEICLNKASLVKVDEESESWKIIQQIEMI
jgi:2'-5' RNA ligase